MVGSATCLSRRVVSFGSFVRLNVRQLTIIVDRRNADTYHLTIDGELWSEVEWSQSRKAWCIQDAAGHCLTHVEHIVGQDREMQTAIRLAKRMIVDGRMPTPEEALASLESSGGARKASADDVRELGPAAMSSPPNFHQLIFEQGQRLALSLRPHRLSGCSTSVKRVPCAAPEPVRPPPAPRSTHAAPTARTAPRSGPATYTQ